MIASDIGVALRVASFLTFSKNHRWDVDNSWTSTETTRFLAILGHSSWPFDRVLVTTECSTNVLTIIPVVFHRT